MVFSRFSIGWDIFIATAIIAGVSKIIQYFLIYKIASYLKKHPDTAKELKRHSDLYWSTDFKGTKGVYKLYKESDIGDPAYSFLFKNFKRASILFRVAIYLILVLALLSLIFNR